MKYLMEFGQEIDYLQGLSTDLPRFPLERYKLDRLSRLKLISTTIGESVPTALCLLLVCLFRPDTAHMRRLFVMCLLLLALPLTAIFHPGPLRFSNIAAHTWPFIAFRGCRQGE